MIVSRSQQHHLMRRVTEERKWLHLTVAIIAGFTVSVVPVFVCYILWVSHVRTPPYVGEINFDNQNVAKTYRSNISNCVNELFISSADRLVAIHLRLLHQPSHLHQPQRQHEAQHLSRQEAYLVQVSTN